MPAAEGRIQESRIGIRCWAMACRTGATLADSDYMWTSPLLFLRPVSGTEQRCDTAALRSRAWRCEQGGSLDVKGLNYGT
eukprot:scaffold7243_cov394-Prasinococcus_capsulatus_cf.AAC.18